MTVRKVITSMLSSSLHAALGAPAACRVARAVRPAAAASPNARASGGSFAPRRGLAVTAASAWRDASELADLLERRHGVGRRAADVAARAERGGGGRATSGKKSDGKKKSSSGAKTAGAPRPGRKGVGPPARRGGKKKAIAVEAKTSASAVDADDFSQNISALDVDDELSAFNDDDTGDYDPRVKRVVAAAPAKMAIVGEFNDDDDDDDFREDKKPDATGVTVAENDFEDEFVFLEDSDGEEETGWEEDDENRDFEDDDGLFLTDADDSLTRKTAAQAKGASVKSCRYLQSCVRVKDCPPPKYPEIAVIGRSNVGKSSLINMLTGRTKKEVAKTSKNPGKTQTINHFEMVTGDGTWYLTDLPGYGFANAPEKQRRQWALFTREYLLERENLIAVMLLIDSTVKPQRLDLECLEFLGENDVPVTVVFTKVDKKRKVKSGVRARPEENVEMFCREVSEYWEEMPPMIFTSSKTGDGKQSVLNHVATLRQFFKEGQNGAR
jgi:GTP-binding protein